MIGTAIKKKKEMPQAKGEESGLIGCFFVTVEPVSGLRAPSIAARPVPTFSTLGFWGK
jgi:hypothetical protein